MFHKIFTMLCGRFENIIFERWRSKLCEILARDLTSKTISLLREVKSGEDNDPMTWVMFKSSRRDVLKVFEALVNSVK